MIYRLPRAARRLIALLLVVLIVGAVDLLAVEPTVDYVSDLENRIQQERQYFGRLQVALADPGPKQRGAEVPPNTAELLLEGESDPVKLATLQTKLAELVSSHGLRLRSARNLPQRERGAVRMVGLQLHVAGPIEALQQTIFTIEQQKPFLIIDALQLTAVATANEEEKGFLDARLDIFGLAALRKGS
jgi:hypothetical protein